MQIKGKKFEWIAQCSASFEQLKTFLTNALVLRITNHDNDFSVCTDACKEGFGGVLMQEGQVIFYASEKLNENEMIYLTHDLELASIIHALKMWRHRLLGRKFTLMTDHIRLNYIFEKPKLSAIWEIWLSILSEVEFHIKYIKGKENRVVGKENRVVDALSRRIEVNHLEAISSYEMDLVGRVTNIGQHDEKY